MSERFREDPEECGDQCCFHAGVQGFHKKAGDLPNPGHERCSHPSLGKRRFMKDGDFRGRLFPEWCPLRKEGGRRW